MSDTDPLAALEAENRRRTAALEAAERLDRLARDTPLSSPHGAVLAHAIETFEATRGMPLRLVLAGALSQVGAPVEPPASKPKRDPGRPAQARQDDILTAIRNAGTPLTREEIVTALDLEGEGKLGANLAWMVRVGVLVNRKPYGYWPATDPLPG